MVTAAEAQAELARRRGQTPPPPPAPAPAAPAPAAAAGSITPDVARQELEKRKQATEQQPGVVEDVIRSAGGGLRRAGEAVAGTFGDIQAAGEGMSNWMMRRLGYTDEDIAKAEQLKSNIIPGPPSTSDVAAATTQMVGPSYKPRTKPGEYVSSIAEQAGALVGPGSWAAKGAQMVGSGLLSQGASDTAQAFGAEKGGTADTIARITGNLAGGFAPSVANRLSRPRTITPERQHSIDVFGQENIPSTAGQRTGDTNLQYKEAIAGVGQRGQPISEAQADAFSAAALRRTGLPAGTQRATPRTVDAELTRMGDEFNRLTAATATPFDQGLQDDLLHVATSYAEEVPMATSFVENFMNDLAQKSAANGGVLDGTVYQNARSKLGGIIRKGDPGLRGPAIDMQEALDDAVSRGMPPDTLREWDTVREQYRNFLPIEHAVGAAGQDAARGVITPQGLRTGIRASQGRRAVAAGRNAWGDLLEAGGELMTPLPQTGTQSRLQQMAAGLGPILAGGAAGMTSGNPLIGIGAATAAATYPVARNAFIASGPGQAFLARQGPQIANDRQGLAQIINAARQAQIEEARR